MKTIEQISVKVAQEMGLIANSVYEAFAKQFLAAWVAQQEPVAWVVKNGLVNYQFANNKQQANALCADLQERHDLSGSLAAFHTVPLFLAPPPAVPEGYALVPKEPSEEMCAEGCLKVGALYGHHGARSMYQAMISAEKQRDVLFAALKEIEFALAMRVKTVRGKKGKPLTEIASEAIDAVTTRPCSKQ